MNKPSTSFEVANEIEDRLITCAYQTDIVCETTATDSKGNVLVTASREVELASGEKRTEAFEIEIRKTKGD